MPCYSTIQTKLIRLADIKKAAEAAGLTLVEAGRTVTVSKGSARVTLYTYGEGRPYQYSTEDARGNYQDEVLAPLTAAYGKVQLKAFAQRRGYIVKPGAKPGQYELVSVR